MPSRSTSAKPSIVISVLSLSMLLLLLNVVLFPSSSTLVDAHAVPVRVANRMVPSWWFLANNERVCKSSADCKPGQCCARPMLSTTNYCLPYKPRGGVCDPSPNLLSATNEVYFNSCPCEKHLTCASLRTSSVCVNLNALQEDIVRITSASEQLG